MKVPSDVIIEQNETPKWYGKMSWKALWKWTFIVLILMLLPAADDDLIIITILGIIVLAVVAYLTIRSTEYFISNRRVYAKFGLISRKAFDIRVDGIQGAIIKQGFIGRILNYGDIIFSTPGQYAGSVVFKGVSDPYFVKGIIDNVIQKNEKRKAVLQKLTDLEKEYEFGKISEDKYIQLRAKYEEELRKYE